MSILRADLWRGLNGQRYNTIAQVVTQHLTTSIVNTSTSTYANIETISITPRYASSKIFIWANYGASGTGAIRLLRGSTTLTASPTGGSAYQHYENDSNTQGGFDSGSLRTQFTLTHYDSPNTTSSVTYTTQIVAYAGGGTNGFSVQAIGPYRNGVNRFSALMLMEILEE